jgi:hypothetical protein
MTPDIGTSLAHYWPLLIIVLVVVRIGIRMSKARALKLERMWIRPLIYLAFGAALLFGAPPPLTPLGVVALIVAVALGAALGWQRGKLVHIEVDPVTHAINQRMSPAAVIFLVVVIALRYGARAMAEQGLIPPGLSVNLIADVLVLFTVAMMVTMNVEMWLRGRRLLSQARAIAV